MHLVSEQMKATTKWLASHSRDSRRSVALLCLGLFFVLQIFSVSGDLHRSLHSDAAAPSHHCVITLFAQGHFSAPGAASGVASIVAAFLFSLPLLRAALLPSLDYKLSPSRAPPRF
jgi:hypothetical protein